MTEAQFFDTFEKRLNSGATLSEYGNKQQWIRLVYALEAYRLSENCPLVNLRLIFRQIRMICEHTSAPTKSVISKDIEALGILRVMAKSYHLPSPPKFSNPVHDRLRDQVKAWQLMINELLDSNKPTNDTQRKQALHFATDEAKELVRQHEEKLKRPAEKAPTTYSVYKEARKKQKYNRGASPEVRKLARAMLEEQIHQLYTERHGHDAARIPLEERRELMDVISRQTAERKREAYRMSAEERRLIKENASLSASHKIRLCLNNQQKSYLQKCFGVSRFCYNWAYDKWIAARERGETVFANQLEEQFNAINKEQYPWTYQVTAFAKKTGFDAFECAQSAFIKGGGFPQRKRHGLGLGSLHFVVTGNRIDPPLLDYNPNSPDMNSNTASRKRQYLFVPGLGYVKMMEKLRFRGLLTSVTIKRHADGHYYASLLVHLPEGEWQRTHKGGGINIDTPIGIDLGLKDFAILSNGICIDSRDVSEKLYQKKRQLQKSIYRYKELHPQCTTARLRRLSWQLGKVRSRMSRQREDFLHKVTSVLAYTFRNISIENLNIKDMIVDGRVRPGDVLESSFYRFRELMQQKCDAAGHRLHIADKFLPSTRTCSRCGCIQEPLPLSQRTFHCNDCGLDIDRDLNAAINLAKLIGLDDPNLRSVDKGVVSAVMQASGITTHQTAEEKQAGLQT